MISAEAPSFDVGALAVVTTLVTAQLGHADQLTVAMLCCDDVIHAAAIVVARKVRGAGVPPQQLRQLKRALPGLRRLVARRHPHALHKRGSHVH